MLRELIVVNIATGEPSLDFDPVMIDDLGGGEIDAHNTTLIDLLWSVTEYELELDTLIEYGVRWSDDRSDPVVACPTCRVAHPLDECAPDDHPDGDRVVCLVCLP